MSLRTEPAPGAEVAHLAETPECPVAKRSIQILEKRGWVSWRCRALNDESILLVDPTVTPSVPLPMTTSMAIYTLDELRLLADGDISADHMRLVHEAKKEGGVITDCFGTVLRQEYPEARP